MNLSGYIFGSRRYRCAFTLIELLVVIAVIALLIGIMLPALSSSKNRARALVCQTRLRQLAQFTAIYNNDFNDQMPRSLHSALTYHFKPWGYAFYSYVYGRPFVSEDDSWDQLFTGTYRCPFDDRDGDVYSYGYNVYYDLTKQETGGRTWRRYTDIPVPSATILFADLGWGRDHMMAHFWIQFDAPPEVAVNRHKPGEAYAFLDGHVKGLRFHETFDIDRQIDDWNPATAR